MAIDQLDAGKLRVRWYRPDGTLEYIVFDTTTETASYSDGFQGKVANPITVDWNFTGNQPNFLLLSIADNNYEETQQQIPIYNVIGNSYPVVHEFETTLSVNGITFTTGKMTYGWGLNLTMKSSDLDISALYDTVTLQISCATEGATIRYTTDGSDPTQSSTLYTSPITVSGTVKAKAWKEGMLSSKVATYTPPVLPEIGSKLSDGSTICYDRGSEYGEYAIEDGDLVKKDSGSDWRYIVCEEYDLNHYETGLGTDVTDKTYSGKQWGIYDQSDSGTETAIGTGKDNTDYLIGKYNSDTYLWYYVNQHRTNTSKDWCVPSKDELNVLYENLTQIGNFFIVTNPDPSASAWYWSSSENSSYDAWSQNFSSGGQYTDYKNLTSYRVRCIRYV